MNIHVCIWILLYLEAHGPKPISFFACFIRNIPCILYIIEHFIDYIIIIRILSIQQCGKNFSIVYYLLGKRRWKWKKYTIAKKVLTHNEVFKLHCNKNFNIFHETFFFVCVCSRIVSIWVILLKKFSGRVFFLSFIFSTFCSTGVWHSCWVHTISLPRAFLLLVM